MQHLPLIINIVVALSLAFVGGWLARKAQLPSMIGYLLAGVVIGPFTPGFIGDSNLIEQLAELGVIFLMFGVGLNFSLRELWEVRAIAIPGAILQIVLIIGLSLLIGSWWNWNIVQGILMGLAIAISSTVVTLRNLMDRGLLNTSQGHAAMGWLVLEDIITVLLLVLLPIFAAKSSEPVWQTVGIALLKTIGFAAIMLVAGTRVLPFVLLRLVQSGSRELFIVALFVVTVGTAIISSEFFGVSLALGAFLAGVVISESSLSSQVEVEITPFRDIFTVLFFVSVGMLVNPLELWTLAPIVLVWTVCIIIGKYVVTFLTGLLFGWSGKTTLTLAAGRGQIGEFSFILGEAGVSLGLLQHEQYTLLLAGAILSITINPFLFRALPWAEKRVQAISALWRLLERRTNSLGLSTGASTLRDHVVLVGCGRVGEQIVRVLRTLDIPLLVVDLNIDRLLKLREKGVSILYGDAVNSEILSHAQVKDARMVIVTLPDEVHAQMVVKEVRKQSQNTPIVVRATTKDGVGHLQSLGAQHVIHPELEGGLEMVRLSLTELAYPEHDILTYTDAVRSARYEAKQEDSQEQEALKALQNYQLAATETKESGIPLAH
ncbi:cation:proton antiporter [Ktedonospora formicarum]|uniref:Sodium/hydrogen exchanger n=1 Tax=Ktedonospora formicarum TaxID=2778364 RepID=A0A8J3HY05_9CHLR|nr:cation:proton antiporter [Ktedonospora formicarum]GHO46277.1 sodium/hydrogen exchanger [Ktedonospora formicarum]